jgi:hypothetical protein
MSFGYYTLRLTIAISLLAITGCAVNNNPGKAPQFSIDQAGIFGKDVEEFILPDKTEARIRLYNDQYSVKFAKHSRVFGIEKATSLRFKSSQDVGDYALIVLEKSEPNCAYKTLLLAIKGAEIRAWDLGNCRAKPETVIYSDTATFDVAEGGTTTRYEFSEGRLLYGNFVPPAAPSYSHKPSPQAPAASNASRPAISQTSVSSQTPSRPKSSDSEPASGKKSTQTTLVLGPKPIFRQREQAPLIINLDK